MSKNHTFYMNANLSDYIGKWIAICDDKVVSEGNEAKKVYSEAEKKCKNKKILLTKVPGKHTMIF